MTTNRPSPKAWPVVLCFAVLILTEAAGKEPTEPTHDQPGPPAPAGAMVFPFEEGVVGETPPGFSVGLTGGGGAVQWEIGDVGAAPSGERVVAQLSDDRTNARYPHLVRDDVEARNVDASISFKTLSGEVDASGGIIFRYLGPDDYYVVRANSLEDNVVAYKTEKGIRSSIGVRGKGDAYGVKAEVPHQEWNTLRVIARDNVFEVFLNGRKLFEVEDETFSEAGKVGLWTKADAVTEFDDLSIALLGD